MKQINLKNTVLAIAITFTTFAFGNKLYLQGESNGYAGAYKVFTTEQAAQNQWTLNYGEGQTPITIVAHEIKGEKVYHVYSASFEVMFVTAKKGFGMRLPLRSLSKVDDRLQSLTVNMERVQELKVISTETPSNEDALQMIAAFLPEVINESYRQLLN